MTWQGIRGHEHLVERFRRSLSNRRLATTFLFVGPEGIGKRTFALQLAQSMLCSKVPEEELNPCGSCADCQQVMSDSHPDLQLVSKPPEKSYIPVDTFIGDRDHRMRSGLCHFISLTPSGGKRRIAIIDDADWLNQEGANSLLKTLEEPSPGAVIILISTSATRQLPTIRSRSQVIKFNPLSDADVAACLLDQGHAEDQETAAAMASLSGGSIAQAIALSDESIAEFRRSLFAELAKPALDRKGFSGLVNGFVDAGGKDTAAKRNQLRIAFRAAIDFYQALARDLVGAGSSQDAGLGDFVSAVRQREGANIDAVVAQIDRCVDALYQVGANANLGILVDAWVCDLATLTRR